MRKTPQEHSRHHRAPKRERRQPKQPRGGHLNPLSKDEVDRLAGKPVYYHGEMYPSHWVFTEQNPTFEGQEIGYVRPIMPPKFMETGAILRDPGQKLFWIEGAVEARSANRDLRR